MKKLLIYCLALAIVASTAGCAEKKTYQLPHDAFCYTRETAQIVEIKPEDKSTIMDLLNNASWVDSLPNCASDYVFYTQTQEISYHSECGTFADVTNQKGFTLTEQQRLDINAMLGLFPQTVVDDPLQPSSPYNALVSWVNWADDSRIYEQALNSGMINVGAIKCLPIFKCETARELHDFKAAFSDILALNQSYDGFPSFEAAVSGFDGTFFENNTLFLVYVDATSGSYRFNLAYYSVTNGTFRAQIIQTNDPEIATCDMAGWLIAIPVSNDQLQAVEKYNAVLIYD